MTTLVDVQAGRQPSVEPSPSSLRVVMMAVVAALGGFLFGFDTAVINGTVPALQAQFRASAWALGLTVSSALLGSALGAFMAGHMADRIGRTRSMLVAAGLFIVSALGCGIAGSLQSLAFWRLVG